MKDDLLAFDKIDYTYPSRKRPALSDLTLRIPDDSITAVLGPNGAGKTTLLHLAMGWLRPGQGRVLLGGKTLPSYTRRQTGQWMSLVPQSEHIPFDYSVLNFVLFGRTPYLQPLAMPGEEDINIASKALARLGLADLAQRSIANLSGGERQMALVARALAQQPRLLLLDEPTAHLDIGNKGRLVKLLRKLSADGVTILFTTHEPDVAAAVADQVVLMRDGQVLKSGDFGDVFTSQDLSNCYQTPVEVVQIGEQRLVIWM